MPTKPKLDVRRMMEKAIDMMKNSIDEPRADKKASPLVGAVLVKPDGTVDAAFRGELRHGDHAEYTLLERKHPAQRHLKLLVELGLLRKVGASSSTKYEVQKQ